MTGLVLDYVFFSKYCHVCAIHEAELGADAKAYDFVVSMDAYNDDVVEREECVNHVHKRIGIALLNLTKQQKLRWPSHEGQHKALYFQRMYRRAIVNNAINVESICSAIWAALFHCLLPDEEQHHTRCPPSEGSWCFFLRAEAVGEGPGPDKDNVHHPLENSVAEALIQVYKCIVGPKPAQAPSEREDREEQ